MTHEFAHVITIYVLGIYDYLKVHTRFFKIHCSETVTRNESVSVIQLKKYDDNRNFSFYCFTYHGRHLCMHMCIYAHNVNL